jgi:hypothetical protein
VQLHQPHPQYGMQLQNEMNILLNFGGVPQGISAWNIAKNLEYVILIKSIS